MQMVLMSSRAYYTHVAEVISQNFDFVVIYREEHSKYAHTYKAIFGFINPEILISSY